MSWRERTFFYIIIKLLAFYRNRKSFHKRRVILLLSERHFPVGKGRLSHKDDSLIAICEQIVQKMWEPRRLTTLWASRACYRDSFTPFFNFNVVPCTPRSSTWSFPFSFPCWNFVCLEEFRLLDVAPCRSCVNRRFGGAYRLHLQGNKISVSRWLQFPNNMGEEWKLRSSSLCSFLY
jgi:hypothetical protein